MKPSAGAVAASIVTSALQVDPRQGAETAGPLTDICYEVAACTEDEIVDVILSLAAYAAQTVIMTAETLGVTPDTVNTEIALAIAEDDAQEEAA